MIRIEHEHSKIVYRVFCFKIIDYDKIEFAENGWKNKYLKGRKNCENKLISVNHIPKKVTYVRN